MSSEASAPCKSPIPAEPGMGSPRHAGRVRPPLPLLGLLVIGALGWLVLGLFQAPAPAVLAAADLTSIPAMDADTGAITGAAWLDANGDGLRDEAELPLPGVTISLYSQDAQLVLAVTTGVNGAYTLAPVAQGQYRIVASGPAGYLPTTVVDQVVYVSPGPPLVMADFGFLFVPSPTPTATPIPMLDTDSAQFATCGGVFEGDTQTGSSNVARYSCKPEWDESGPELIYRLELGQPQLLRATLLTSTADLDLFLLRSADPQYCLQAGDTYVSQEVEPGVYFVVVDGYRGATGSFTLKFECPLAPQATATTTRTPTTTPTATPVPTTTLTPTPGPTLTATAAGPRVHTYLPVILAAHSPLPEETTTLSFQQDINGYKGTSDTTLNSWEPGRIFGAEPLLRLRYNRTGGGSTEMAPVIRFDLSMLPREAQVVSATLRLYADTKSNRNDLQGELRGLLRAWDESSATWLESAAGVPWTVAGAQGIDQDIMAWSDDRQAIADEGAWYGFDATELVQQWVADPPSNRGAILLARAGATDANVEAGFASRNASASGRRPQLSVTYWLPEAAAGQ